VQSGKRIGVIRQQQKHPGQAVGGRLVTRADEGLDLVDHLTTVEAVAGLVVDRFHQQPQEIVPVAMSIVDAIVDARGDRALERGGVFEVFLPVARRAIPRRANDPDLLDVLKHQRRRPSAHLADLVQRAGNRVLDQLRFAAEIVRDERSAHGVEANVKDFLVEQNLPSIVQCVP
jgi:hypothetical protein